MELYKFSIAWVYEYADTRIYKRYADQSGGSVTDQSQRVIVATKRSQKGQSAA